MIARACISSCVLAAAVMLLGHGVAHARPALSDVPEIEEPLFAVAIAHVLRENCPDLAARELKGIAVLWSLRSKANR